MVLSQILGILSILFGLFLIFGVPDRRQFQPEGMAKTSILIGMFFIILGIYLVTR